MKLIRLSDGDAVMEETVDKHDPPTFILNKGGFSLLDGFRDVHLSSLSATTVSFSFFFCCDSVVVLDDSCISLLQLV